MLKFKGCFALILLLPFLSFKPAKTKVNWLTLEELAVKYNENPKPIIIDLYTDWCGWCKVMEKNTYGDPKVAKYLNDNFYAVKFNAESDKTVSFNNKTFSFNTQYKSNELALYLTFGRLEYPTTVFLSTMDARPAPLSGYLKPREIEAPIKYFGDKANLSKTFVEFEKQLKKEW